MARVTLGGFEATILDPKIIVFHDAIKNCDELIEHYEKDLPWRGWFGFGRQVDELGPTIVENPEFPTWDEWKSQMIDSVQDPFRQHIAEVFYKTSVEYFKYNSVTYDNWTCKNWSLARYLPDVDAVNHPDLTMNYHTDYQESKRDQPGEKFATTAVIYPNDDYDGGEISFKIAGPDGEVADTIEYKPVKGDIVFFSAEHPYYHGVRRVWGKAKYIIRLYWQYTSEGTQDWHDLHAKYGDAFRQMENDRINRHDLMIARPLLRPMFSINEYYERLEAGTLPLPEEHGY